MKFLMLAATLVFSQELVEQILAELQRHPYVEVAPLIAKMQNEAMHQPKPPPAPSKDEQRSDTSPEAKEK